MHHSIMLADDTSFFLCIVTQNILEIANQEIKNEWSSVNKLSLNAGKTKHIFFHKQKYKENVSLHLLDLTINNICQKKVDKLKFWMSF